MEIKQAPVGVLGLKKRRLLPEVVRRDRLAQGDVLRKEAELDLFLDLEILMKIGSLSLL